MADLVMGLYRTWCGACRWDLANNRGLFCNVCEGCGERWTRVVADPGQRRRYLSSDWQCITDAAKRRGLEAGTP